MPRVSVIIPTYNQADWLKECLESLTKQTYKDFETIVINNHSTDHTSDVIESFPELGITHILFNNGGIIGAARNKGIDTAKGDLIAFLDSDDTWLETKLADVIDEFNKQPSIDIVCNDEIFMGNDEVEGKPYPSGDATSYLELLLGPNCMSTSAVTVKKARLKDAKGFSEEKLLAGVEDYDLWLRLLKNGCKAFYLHKPLGYCRIHGGSFSSKLIRQSQRKTFLLNRHLSALAPNFKAQANKRKAMSYRSSANALQKQKDFKLAIKYCKKALSTYPYQLKTWLGLFYIYSRKLVS